MTEEQQLELLNRLRSNDRDALQLLFRQYYALVCHAIHRYIKDPQLVEDIAQDLFIKQFADLFPQFVLSIPLLKPISTAWRLMNPSII